MSGSTEDKTFMNAWFARSNPSLSALIWQFQARSDDSVRYEAQVQRGDEEIARISARGYDELLHRLAEEYETGSGRRRATGHGAGIT